MAKETVNTKKPFNYSKVTSAQDEIIKDNAISEKDKPGNSKNNLIGLTLLLLLSTIQGIPISFYKMSMPLLLTEKGANFTDLGILAILAFPLSLKFLVAPILDTFYIKRFGQRKSYIVPAQYLYAGVSLILAYHLKEYIENLNITMIFIFGLLSIILVAIQDVAIDGWICTLLTEDYMPYVPSAQMIGTLTGNLLAFNLFIPLNSSRFCNHYIFSAPQEEPLIPVGTFWYLNAIFVLAVTVVIHFFIKEKEASSETNPSFFKVIKTLTLFYKNPNLRQLSIVCLTQFIGIMPIVAYFEAVLMQKGFHKETLTNIYTFLSPLEIFISIAIGRISSGKKPLKVYMVGHGIAVFKAVAQLSFLWFYSADLNFYLVVFILVILQLATSISKQVTMISMFIFCNKIFDEATGASFIATRTAFDYSGVTATISASLFLSEYLPWYVICSGASVLGIANLFRIKRVTEDLTTKKETEFYTSKSD